jgi:hypothetical protein
MICSWGGTSSSSQVDIEAQHTLSFSCVSLRSLLSVLGTQNTVFRNVEVVMNAITQKMLCIRGVWITHGSMYRQGAIYLLGHTC